jgi:hypothetical protein
MRVQLTLTVDYMMDDDSQPDEGECHGLLEELARFAANRGLLTGEAPGLYADEWNYDVKTVKSNEEMEKAAKENDKRWELEDERMAALTEIQNGNSWLDQIPEGHEFEDWDTFGWLPASEVEKESDPNDPPKIPETYEIIALLRPLPGLTEENAFTHGDLKHYELQVVFEPKTTKVVKVILQPMRKAGF